MTPKDIKRNEELFADTEISKNVSQQIIISDFSGYFTKMIERLPDINSH
jgi:hypothetical protein